MRPPVGDGGTGIEGSPLGRSQGGGAFAFDPFDAYEVGLVSNPNMLVTGAIGSGKSTVVKMILARGLERRRRVVVLDPKGEYRDLAREFDGTVIELSGASVQWWSPFVGSDREDLLLIATVLAAAKQQTLDDAERYLLEKGWLDCGAGRSPRPVAALLEHFGGHLDDVQSSPARSLALLLRRLVEGDLAGIFDGDAHDARAPASPVVLDISKSWSSENFAIVALAAAAVARRLADDHLEASYLVIDEAWSVLADSRVAHWLHGSWKLARATATSHVLVLHRWSDAFAAADEGSAHRVRVAGILRDCDTSILLRQDPAEHAVLVEVLGLSALESRLVLDLPRGTGLARYGAHRSVVQFRPDDRDRRIVDTDRAMRGAM